MKTSEFRKLIREEIRKVLKETVSPSEMKDGIPLPFDNGKIAGMFVKLAKKMGLKQGTWNNGEANGDYSFDYEMGDADSESELVNEKGQNSEGNNPSAIFILNPKMQSDPTVQKLAQKAMEEMEEFED